MKNAAKVDKAVMVTDKFKFPPNMTVQILEAPPPGDVPETDDTMFENNSKSLNFKTSFKYLWQRDRVSLQLI